MLAAVTAVALPKLGASWQGSFSRYDGLAQGIGLAEVP